MYDFFLIFPLPFILLSYFVIRPSLTFSLLIQPLPSALLVGMEIMILELTVYKSAAWEACARRKCEWGLWDLAGLVTRSDSRDFCQASPTQARAGQQPGSRLAKLRRDLSPSSLISGDHFCLWEIKGSASLCLDFDFGIEAKSLIKGYKELVLDGLQMHNETHAPNLIALSDQCNIFQKFLHGVNHRIIYNPPHPPIENASFKRLSIWVIKSPFNPSET